VAQSSAVSTWNRSSKVIRLTPQQLGRITRHLEAAYPNEGCGLLVGTGRDNVAVTRVAAAPNVTSEDATIRFEVDPKFQFDLMRELEGSSERIVGHFHSHPDGSPIPSERDKKMALDKELIWLIVAVEKGKAGTPQAYAVEEEEKDFQPIPLIIE